MHTPATKVYEKGPQSLANNTKEVEKLQTAQQLKSTLLPPSLVNTKSSDADKCFQCQETGHMACYCPHIRCFDCNNYGQVAADCSEKSHLQAHQQDGGTTPLVGVTDQHCGVIITPGITTTTIGIGTDSVDLDATHITLDIGVTVTVIIAEVTLDPFTGPHIIAHCATEVQAHTATAKTPHTVDPHHAEISPEMTVDPGQTNPTNTIPKLHKDHLPLHNQHPGSPRIGSTNRLQLMTHHQNIIALMNRTVIRRMI